MENQHTDIIAVGIFNVSKFAGLIMKKCLAVFCFVLMSLSASLSVQAAPPANDDFVDATLISGGSGDTFSSNSDATAEAAEPDHINAAIKSIWFKWIAPNTDSIDFDTQNSNFDSVLAVYTGTDINSLVLVASNNDDPLLGCCNSRISLTPVAGQAYYIAVDGFQAGDSGNIFLHWGPAPKAISGTLSLPNGELAPPAGLTVSIIFEDQNSSQDPGVIVTIPAGMNSADYAATVPNDLAADWLVSYQCDSITMGCGGGYYTSGYYNSNDGTQWNPVLAEALPGGQHYSNINLSLLNGQVISGNLSLPGVELASSLLSIDIFATNVNGPEQYSDRFNLPINAHVTPYQLILPEVAGAEWNLDYYCLNDCSIYVDKGYYNTSGTQWNSTLAETLPLGVNPLNVDLDILPAITISGNLSLPSGAAALASDMLIRISISSQSSPELYQETVQILAGNNSDSYLIKVPLDASISWQLAYQCESYFVGCENYLKNGYYNSASTQWDESAATLLSGVTGHTGIDLSLLEGNELSGTVSFPGVDTAPAGGMSLAIYIDSLITGESIRRVVNIGAGLSSASYSFQVIPDPAGQWQLRYHCSLSSNGCNNYLENGYYSSGGTQWNPALADAVSAASSQSGLDLVLQSGVQLSGMIQLPAPNVAPVGGMQVSISVVDDNGTTNIYTNVFIAENQSAVNYSVQLPPDAAANWHVRYSCSSFVQACGAYIGSGYYSVAGTQWDAVLAGDLAGAAVHNGIDLTLLQGLPVSGTVSLPSPEVAPVGGMNVLVSVRNELGTTGYFSFATIAEGATAGAYTVQLPDEVSQRWQLGYLCDSSSPACSEYVPSAYYSNSGTQWNILLGDLVTGGQIHSGIDLILLQGKALSGRLNLPSGEVAPVGGIPLGIQVINQGFKAFYSVNMTLMEGASFADYYFTIPPDSGEDWQVGYVCDNYNGNCDDYIQSAWYSTTGTQWDPNQASNLSGGSPHSNIDLMVLDGYLMSGSVSLPGGDVAPSGGLQLDITLSQPGGDLIDAGQVTIATGDQSADYSIRVPVDNLPGWNLGYRCAQSTSSGCVAYVAQGFYASPVTQWDVAQADVLPGGTALSGLDMTLLTGNAISGQISLPAADLAIFPGVPVELRLARVGGTGVAVSGARILPGSQSIDYTIVAPLEAGADWRLSYHCLDQFPSCQPYTPTAYYSTSGTQADVAQASVLDGSLPHSNIDLQLLSGTTISGVIALPVSQTAPSGGIDIDVVIHDQNSAASMVVAVSIASGANSVSYSSPVSLNAAASWAVDYVCSSECEDYLPNGYYSGVGTQWDASLATGLSGGVEHENVNLTLLTGNAVTGSVSLPDGGVAAVGGVDIDVLISDLNSATSYTDQISIIQGASLAVYEFEVAPDSAASWQVQYACMAGCDAYLTTGYYSTGGTRKTPAEASALSGGNDHAGIDMVLLSGYSISGQLVLPAAELAPAGGIEIGITLHDKNSAVSFSNTLNLASGESTVIFDYSISTDPGAAWEIDYHCNSGCGDYLVDGYYSQSGTQWDASLAGNLAGAMRHSNIELELIEGDRLSGVIYLPGADMVAVGGMSIDIEASDLNSASARSKTIILSEGDASAAYVVILPPDAGADWQVAYQCTAGCGDYELRGYYSTGNTQLDPVFATTLSGGGNHGDVDLTLVQSSTAPAAAMLPVSIIEDFSDARLSCQNNWGNKYFTDGEVFTQGGKLHLRYNPYAATAKDRCGVRAVLAAEGVRRLQTTMRVEDIHGLSGIPGGEGVVEAGLMANPYGAIANPGGTEGQVYAFVRISRTGGIMRAHWTLLLEDFDEAANPGLTAYQDGDFVTVPQVATDYVVALEYNAGTQKFVFGFNGEEVVIDAPPELAPADWDYFRLMTRASFSDDSGASTVLYAFTPAENEDVSVHAVFGEVRTGADVLYDDFSNALSAANWQEPEHSGLNQNGVHKFTVKTPDTQSTRRRFKLQEDNRLTPLLGVKGRLADSSAGLGRLRVVGVWFNGLYDGNYNGEEGDVFGTIYLKRENNAYSAEVWLGQSLNDDFTSTQAFIDGVAFNMAIDPSKFYDMSIQMADNGNLVFKIIDDNDQQETQVWLNDGLGIPNTILPVYPSSSPYKAIEVRAQNSAGEVISYIDDIYIRGEGTDSFCMPIKSNVGTVVVICL